MPDTGRRNSNEFMPPWTGQGKQSGGEEAHGGRPAPPVGRYIFGLKVIKGEWRDTTTKKPFALFTFEVLNTESRPTEHAGFIFSSRQYFTEASEGIVRWFLTKFGYSEEELAKDRPQLYMDKIIGLQGEAIVEITEHNTRGLRFDLRAYGRTGEGDFLDKKLEKMAEEDANKEQEVDVHQDVKDAAKQEHSELEDLDEPDETSGKPNLD
jgi:hypothetical protein